MSAQTQDPAIYVTCQNYCGKRISDPLTDHDEGCGAPLAERKRIESELRILKIQAVAAPQPEVSWRCSCGEEFESQDDLGTHHTSSGHQGMWLVDGDSETEDGVPREREIEVDSQRARLRQVPVRETIPEKPAWRELPVPGDWVLVAQQEIDAGKIAIGGLAAGKKCSGRQVIDGYEVECPHQPAMRSVEVIECDAGKHHSTTLQQLCLVHWVRLLAGNIPAAGLGPLLDGIT